MQNTVETTQNSLRLMNEIRSTRLFTIPTTGTEKKLTQRLTNLCVSVTAMLLLSYALIEFLEKNFKDEVTEEKRKEIMDMVLKYPDNPKRKTKEQQEEDELPVLATSSRGQLPDGYDMGLRPVKEKKAPLFIQKLLTICCGVISPRSLNGLNHCNLDNEFHVANQAQKIIKCTLFASI